MGYWGGGERDVFVSQNPRDFYLVGNTVEYSCIDGHYLSGDAVAQCTETQKWRRGAMVCKSTSSRLSGIYVFRSPVCSLARGLRNDLMEQISNSTFECRCGSRSRLNNISQELLSSLRHTQNPSSCPRFHMWDSSAQQ